MANKDYISVSEYNKLKEANGGKDPTKSMVSSYIFAKSSGMSKSKAVNSVLKQRENDQKAFSDALSKFASDYSQSRNTAANNYSSRTANKQYQGSGTEAYKQSSDDYAAMLRSAAVAQGYLNDLNRNSSRYDSDYVDAATSALNSILKGSNEMSGAIKNESNYWNQFSNPQQYIAARASADKAKAAQADVDRIKSINVEDTQKKLQELRADRNKIAGQHGRSTGVTLIKSNASKERDAKIADLDKQIASMESDLNYYNQYVTIPAQENQRSEYLSSVNVDDLRQQLAQKEAELKDLNGNQIEFVNGIDAAGGNGYKEFTDRTRSLSSDIAQLKRDIHEADSSQVYTRNMQLTGNSDFADMSAYSAPEGSSSDGWYKRRVESGESVDDYFKRIFGAKPGEDIDTRYMYINGDSAARETMDNAAMLSAGTDSGSWQNIMGATDYTSDWSIYQHMTDDEVKVYNYLYATQGKEKADEFLDSNGLRERLNARKVESQEIGNARFAQINPGLASAASVLTSPLNGLSYIGQAADYAADGYIDKNAQYNNTVRTNSSLRNNVTQKIEKYWVSKGSTGKVATFLYQTGMSMADFIYQSALTRGVASAGSAGAKIAEAITLGIMGTGAAAQTTIDSLDRGLNSQQAFTLGTIAGAAEILSEKISLEALFNEAAMNTDALKYFLQNAFFEGAEEVESDIINLVADILVSKDKSEWNQSIEQYKLIGYSANDAFIQAMKDQAENMGLDFLGGALSGGVMGGVSLAGNYIGNVSQGKSLATESVEKGKRTYTNIEALANSLIDEAMNEASNTEARTVAERMDAKRKSGKELSMADLGKLFNSVTNTQAEAAGENRFDYRDRKAAELEHKYAASLAKEGKIKPEEATRSRAVKEAAKEAVKEFGRDQYDIDKSIVGTKDDGTAVAARSMASFSWDSESGTGGIQIEVVDENGAKETVSVSDLTFNNDIEDAITLANMVTEGSDITDGSILSDGVRTAMAARLAGNASTKQIAAGYMSIYAAARQGMSYYDAVTTAGAGTSVRASVNAMNDEQKSLAYKAGENAGRILSAKDGSRNMGKGLTVKVTGKIGKTLSQKLNALNDFMMALGRKATIVDNLEIGMIGAEEGAVVLTWKDPSAMNKLNAAYVKHADGSVEYFFNKNSQDTAFMFVAVHESIHDIRANLKAENGMSGEQVYQKMASLVEEFYKKQGVFNDMLKHQLKLQGIEEDKIKDIMYPSNSRQSAIRDAAMEEIVANAVPAILANESTMEQFAMLVATSDGASRNAFERFIHNIKQFLAEALEALSGRGSWSQLKAIRDNQKLVDQLYALYEDAFTRLAQQNKAPSQMAGKEFTQSQADDIVMDKASEVTEMPHNKPSKADEDLDAEYMQLAKDPEKNKSRLQEMVREAAYRAGYNLLAFHGTDKKFNSFKPHFAPGWGTGIYLATDRNVAEDYGNVMELYVNSNKLFRLDNDADVNYVEENMRHTKAYNSAVEEYLYYKYIKLLDDEDSYKNEMDLLGSGISNIGYYDFLDADNDLLDGFNSILRELGYDGVMSYEGNIDSGYEIVIYDSSNAKSASPVTYDDYGNIIPISKRFDRNFVDIRWSRATYEEQDIKPGLTRAAAKKLGIPESDITMVANTTNGKKDVVYVSGRSVLDAVMNKYAKENGMSKAQIASSLEFMDGVSRWMDEVAVAKYHYIGLQDLNNAKMKIDWRNGKKVILSARVKNGEYDVNFDLSKICKKRVAFSAFIDDLATRTGKNGKATMLDEVDLSPENIFKMNEILKDMGYETACLGCFVESRRYGIKSWAETIVNEWNAKVDEAVKDAGYFDFAGGETSTSIDTISAAEIKAIDKYMEDYKAAVKKVGANVVTEANQAKIAALEEEKKKRKAELPKSMTKAEKKLARNQIDAEFNPQIAELKMNAQAKMLPLIQSDPRLQKKLRVGDLISSQGRTALHEYSAELESIVASRFGTSSPKSVEAFAPYNSEIALLPDTKSIGRGENKIVMTQQEYLSSIAGVRSQSFSDFIISQVYDHLQKTADIAARGFKAHTYTKEIARAMLFGMTGEKINMSVMFDINPDVSWEYAGLNGNSIDAEYAVADWRHGMTDEEAAAAEKAGDHRFTYSIPFKEAVDIEHNPVYSKSCGIIGVGHSYFGMLKMFRDERIPYIIGYHRSGMPEAIMKATHIELSADYTNVQNTLHFGSGVQFRTVKNAGSTTVPSYATWGGSAKKETKASDLTFDLKQALKDNGGNGRAAMQSFLDFMQSNTLTPNVSKAAAGHGSFDLYGDLEKTMDPNRTANNYIAWCIENDMIPMFYEFAAEEDYSKILFDFSVRDLANGGACSPQVPVSMDGLIDLGIDEWTSIASRYMDSYDKYMKRQFFGNKYEQTLSQIYDTILSDELRPFDVSAPKNESEAEEAATSYSRVDNWDMVPHDDKEYARRDFETGNTTTVYRAMQLIDGKLYPPMAAVVDGQMVGGVTEGDVVMADERPDLAVVQYWDKDGNGHKKGDVKLDKDGNPAYYFVLKKGTLSDDGKKQTDVPARYNPYIHTSRSLINDQFASAWNRGHLVTVEVEIPNSELTAGYKAEKAKDPVGELMWKSGPVSGKLAKNNDPRYVILSRYSRIGRIIPTSEVADLYAEKVNKFGIEVPFNTVNKYLRDALVERGVVIGAPESGSSGKAAIPAYKEWKAKNPVVSFNEDTAYGGSDVVEKYSRMEPSTLKDIQDTAEVQLSKIADDFSETFAEIIANANNVKRTDVTHLYYLIRDLNDSTKDVLSTDIGLIDRIICPAISNAVAKRKAITTMWYSSKKESFGSDYVRNVLDAIADVANKTDDAKSFKVLSVLNNMKLSSIGDAVENAASSGIGGYSSVNHAPGRMDISDVRKMFARLNSNIDMQRIAKKVFDACENLGIRFVWMDDSNVSDLLEKDIGNAEDETIEHVTNGLTHLDIGYVRFNGYSYFNDSSVPNQRKAITILHEIIHAITGTQYVFASQNQQWLIDTHRSNKAFSLINTWYRIWDFANRKEILSGSLKPNAVNLFEFIVAASDPGKVEMLNNFKVRDLSNDAIFDRDKEFYKTFHGKDIANMNVGDATLDIIQRFIDSSYDLSFSEFYKYKQDEKRSTSSNAISKYSINDASLTDEMRKELDPSAVTLLYIRETREKFATKVMSGEKVEETRTDLKYVSTRDNTGHFKMGTFQVGDRVGIVSDDGKMLIGYATIQKINTYHDAAEFHAEDAQQRHMVPVGNKYDIKPGQTKYGLVFGDLKKLDTPIPTINDMPRGSRSADIIRLADALMDAGESRAYSLLRDRTIVPAVDRSADIDERSKTLLAAVESVNPRALSKARESICALARSIGIINRNMSNSGVNIEFTFSFGGGLSESLSQQLKYSGNYHDFARVILNLEQVVNGATVVQARSTDRYEGTKRENRRFENSFVLLGMLEEKDKIIPVKLEIKKESGNKEGNLYVVVSLGSIKNTGVLERQAMPNGKGHLSDTGYSYSITDVVKLINPSDGRFLKNLPNQMLDADQITAKEKALADDASYIEKLRKEKEELDAKRNAGRDERKAAWLAKQQAEQDLDTPKFKMSVADTDDVKAVRSAIMENEKTLKVLADLAKGNDKKIITDERLSRRQINKIARDIVKTWGSDANYKDIADILYEAYSPMFSGDVETDSFALLADAAEKIIKECYEPGTSFDEFNDIVYAVNNAVNETTKIMLTPAETQNVKSMFSGSFAEFRRALRGYGINIKVYPYKAGATGYISSDTFFTDIAGSSYAYLIPDETDGNQFPALVDMLFEAEDNRLVSKYDEKGKNEEHLTREQAIIKLQSDLVEMACSVRSEAMSERADREAAELTADESRKLKNVSDALAATAKDIREELLQYEADSKAKQARTAEIIYEGYQSQIEDFEARIGAINDELSEMKKLDTKRRAKIRQQEQALTDLKSNLLAARDELKAKAWSMSLMQAVYARDIDTAVKMQAGIVKADLQKQYAEKLAALRADKKAVEKDYAETMSAYNKVLADVSRQAKKDVRKAYKAGRLDRSAEVRERDLKRKYREKIAAKTKTLSNMLTNPTEKKYIPEGARTTITGFVGLMANHKAILDGGKIHQLADFYRSMGKGEISGDEAQDLMNMFDEDIYDRIVELSNAIGGRRISELSSDELKEVYEISNVFYYIARHYDDVRRRGRSESLKTSAGILMRQLSSMGDRKDYGDLEKALGFLVNNQTPYYFFKGVGGELQSYYQDIDDGVKTYTMNVQDAAKRIAEIKKTFGYDSWSADTDDNRISIDTASRRVVSLTRGEAMLIWATRNREILNASQKANHLKSGGIVMQEDRKSGKNKGLTAVANRLTDENLDAIDKWLTPEQKSCANALVSYLSNDMAELGNQVSMQLYGINKFEEKYYIPYNCAGTYLNKQIGGGAVSLDSMLKTISFSQRLTTRADAPILVDDIFNVASRHVERMCMYNALCIPLDNLNRLLNYKQREQIAVDEDGNPIMTPIGPDGKPIPLYNEDGSINSAEIDIHYDDDGYPLTKSVVGDSVRTMLTAKYGSNVVKYIDTFLSDMNGGANTDPRENFGSRMLSLFKKNAVMMSASVAVQQPSAIGRAFAMINPKYFAQTMFDRRDYDELSKYSYTAVLKSIGGFDTGTGRGIADWINGGAAKSTDVYGKVLDAVDEYGGKAPEFMDQVTWSHIWNAVKKEQADLHPELTGEDLLKAAGARFDEVINATQVYDSTISRSANMRSKTWYMKAATAFMAEPTVAYNLLSDAIREAVVNKNSRYAGRAIASFVTAALLNSMLKSIVTAARKQDDDETYAEKYVGEFLGNFFSEMNPFGLVPIAKDVVSIFQGYTVSRSDMDAIQDVKDAYDALMSENKTAMDKINAVAGAVSILSGIPVKNVMRDVEAVVNVISNGIKMSGKGSSQGMRLSVEAAISEVWPFSMFVKSSNKDYAARIIKAYSKGDMDEVEATIRDYQFKLDRSGKTAEEIGKKTTSWLKKAIRDAYADGDLDYATAYKMLNEIADIDDKVAFKTLQSVDYDDTEYSDSSSAYIGVYDAIDNDKDVEAAVQKMIKSGYKEDDVRSQVVYGIMELYKGKVDGKAKISSDKAKSMLVKYGKLDSDKAAQKVKESNVYITYGVEYTSNYSNLKEALKKGTLTREQCIKILMNARGYSREKAADVVSGWNK